MPKEFDYEDFIFEMAEILNEEREVKMREAALSQQNAQNATKYNFTKEGFDEVVKIIRAKGQKPTRERMAEEFEISLPTLRKWFEKLKYKIPK